MWGALLGSPWRKAVVAVIAVAVAVSSALVVRAAGDGGSTGGDNTAVAVNTNDDSTKFKLSFKITRVNADTVDASNAAAAVSSCENCETIAIAIQAVVVWEDPSIVSPTNLAIAINQNCTECLSYADARQHVVGTDGISRFTAEGNQRIKDIRADLRSIRKEDLTPEEIEARVDAASAALADVLRDELVLVNARSGGASPTPGASPDAEDAAAETPQPPATPDVAADEPAATPAATP